MMEDFFIIIFNGLIDYFIIIIIMIFFFSLYQHQKNIVIGKNVVFFIFGSFHKFVFVFAFYLIVQVLLF
jgi:hypothetical protein